MKFLNSLKVIAAVVFVLMNLSQVWAELHSVSFADNGSVYYQSGATQEEATSLATYLESIGIDNADMRVERDSDSNTLVVKLIPANGSASHGQLNAYGQEFEQNVFGEKVLVVACDEDFHSLY